MIGTFLAAVAGVIVGSAIVHSNSVRRRSTGWCFNSSDPKVIIMTVIAAVQAQLDRLAEVPAGIDAKVAAAVAAATEGTVPAADVTDTVAAVTAAVDATRAAAGIVEPAPVVTDTAGTAEA
jgi:uncharacterized protein (DUF885 family)